jgi:hypothetical protein
MAQLISTAFTTGSPKQLLVFYIDASGNLRIATSSALGSNRPNFASTTVTPILPLTGKPAVATDSAGVMHLFCLTRPKGSTKSSLLHSWWTATSAPSTFQWEEVTEIAFGSDVAAYLNSRTGLVELWVTDATGLVRSLIQTKKGSSPDPNGFNGDWTAYPGLADVTTLPRPVDVLGLPVSASNGAFAFTPQTGVVTRGAGDVHMAMLAQNSGWGFVGMPNASPVAVNPPAAVSEPVSGRPIVAMSDNDVLWATQETADTSTGLLGWSTWVKTDFHMGSGERTSGAIGLAAGSKPSSPAVPVVAFAATLKPDLTTRTLAMVGWTPVSTVAAGASPVYLHSTLFTTPSGSPFPVPKSDPCVVFTGQNGRLWAFMIDASGNNLLTSFSDVRGKPLTGTVGGNFVNTSWMLDGNLDKAALQCAKTRINPSPSTGEITMTWSGPKVLQKVVLTAPEHFGYSSRFGCTVTVYGGDGAGNWTPLASVVDGASGIPGTVLQIDPEQGLPAVAYPAHMVTITQAPITLCQIQFFEAD